MLHCKLTSLRLFGQRGFTLLESLMTLAILSMMVTGVIQFVSAKYKEERIKSLMVAKQRVMRQVESTLSDPGSIKSALEVLNGPNGLNNTIFQRCIGGVQPCPAAFTSPATMRQMDFYVADGRGGRIKLNGMWTRQGAPGCLPGGGIESCPFQTLVYFWFTCSANRATGAATLGCVRPTHVNMVYEVRPTNAADENNVGVNMFHPGRAPGGIPNPTAVAHRVAVESLLNVDQSCSSEHYVEGFDGSGHIICKCNNHNPRRNADASEAKDSLNRPICQDNRCTPPKVLMGYNMKADGDWSPVCLTEGEAKYCYRVNIDSTPYCAAGFWLSKVEYGTCTANAANAQTKKKGDNTQVLTCAGDSGECCQVPY